MLLKQLRVTNRRGDVLDLPLENLSSGFKVKKITGLDPVKATLVSSSFANLDGHQYHSSRREPRNMVITLGLDPDYSVESVYSLRSQLYEFFMPKTPAKLQFRAFDKFSDSVLTQNLNVEIEARIEDFDSDLFVQEPEVIITLLCFQPDFVDPDLVSIEAMTTDGLDPEILHYSGSIETGVEFVLFPDRPLTDFAIYHRPPDQTLRTVNFTGELEAGDVLQIGSVGGSKHVTHKRAGIERSVLAWISPESNWLEFHRGENQLRVYAVGDPIPFAVYYTTKYGGL